MDINSGHSHRPRLTFVKQNKNILWSYQKWIFRCDITRYVSALLSPEILPSLVVRSPHVLKLNITVTRTVLPHEYLSPSLHVLLSCYAIQDCPKHVICQSDFLASCKDFSSYTDPQCLSPFMSVRKRDKLTGDLTVNRRKMISAVAARLLCNIPVRRLLGDERAGANRCA